jgi:hypothetical protein
MRSVLTESIGDGGSNLINGRHEMAVVGFCQSSECISRNPRGMLQIVRPQRRAGAKDGGSKSIRIERLNAPVRSSDMFYRDQEGTNGIGGRRFVANVEPVFLRIGGIRHRNTNPYLYGWDGRTGSDLPDRSRKSACSE